jgi:hypothetical protein
MIPRVTSRIVLSAGSLVILSAAKDLFYHEVSLHGWSSPCHPERSEGSPLEKSFPSRKDVTAIRRRLSSPDEILVSQDHPNGCDYSDTFGW